MAASARWYIVQAYSGYEKKVADAIKASAELHGLEALIEEVLVPVEEVVSIKKGKKVTKNHYRNYIKKRFLNNLLNDFNLESIYFVMGLGYAKFKDDDAYVARHIIVKK